MRAAAWYGILLGIVLVVLDTQHSPMAWACWWALQTVMLAVYTKVTWQRTRWVWMTVGGALGTVMSAGWVPASLAGFTIRTLPHTGQIAWWTAAGTLVAIQVGAEFAYRDQFAQWRRDNADLTLADMLHLRHIPRLR